MNNIGTGDRFIILSSTATHNVKLVKITHYLFTLRQNICNYEDLQMFLYRPKHIFFQLRNKICLWKNICKSVYLNTIDNTVI